MSALQAQLAALSTQLEQQEAEAISVIQVWEEQFAEAEEDNKLLSIELEKAKSKETELSELRDLLSRGEEKFDRLKGTFNNSKYPLFLFRSLNRFSTFRRGGRPFVNGCVVGETAEKANT